MQYDLVGGDIGAFFEQLHQVAEFAQLLCAPRFHLFQSAGAREELAEIRVINGYIVAQKTQPLAMGADRHTTFLVRLCHLIVQRGRRICPWCIAGSPL